MQSWGHACFQFWSISSIKSMSTMRMLLRDKPHTHSIWVSRNAAQQLQERRSAAGFSAFRSHSPGKGSADVHGDDNPARNSPFGSLHDNVLFGESGSTSSPELCWTVRRNQVHAQALHVPIMPAGHLFCFLKQEPLGILRKYGDHAQ